MKLLSKMKKLQVTIDNFIVGSDRTFIVAELSANHNQDFTIAIETIKAAKRAGADAIKLQTYTPDTITLDCKNDYFKLPKGSLWEGKYLYDLYKKAYTPWEWHEELFKVAKEEGLICFSTPFDKTAVDFLEQFNPPVYKIASFEITDIPLISYAASKGRPIIISTGIATIEDIELAINTCKEAGNTQIILLKCTSQYPALPEDANLLTIPDLKDRFGVEVGLSDHTPGIEAPVVAVSLGAKVIEKHFILNKSIGGPDASFSLDEKEFKQMADAVRNAEKMLGKVDYEMTEKKRSSRTLCRSLFITEDVKKGDEFSAKNVRSIRPGHGLEPRYFNQILGRIAKKNIQRGTPLSWDLVD